MSKRGIWMNVTGKPTPASEQHWPPSVVVSSCAIVVYSEQPGHFHSVTGTDKIVLSQPTVLPQTAPVEAERGQASDQSNRPREQHQDRY